jgi:acetolactate decarboxylase
MTTMKPMICFVLLLSLVLAFAGCNTTTIVQMLDRHALYQSTPLAYLQAGNYNTSITTGQFKSIGNFGIGTFDGFAGEAVMLDGVVYQISGDGKITTPPDQAKLFFGSCILFDVEKRFTMRHVQSYTDFQKALQGYFSTNLHIRAIQVEGTFKSLRVSCIEKQAPPYKPFNEASRQAKMYTWKEMRGTLVGFWTPPSVPEAVMAPGFHLKFISEDKTMGGHVIDFQADKLTILMKNIMRMTVNYSPTGSSHFDSDPQ